jgi:hypothetical protein
MNQKLFIQILFSIILFSCNTKKSSTDSITSSTNGSVLTIKESNDKLEDLKYLIGIKIRAVAKKNDLETAAKKSESEIEMKYQSEVNNILANSGFTADDFLVDSAIGTPNDDYHTRKFELAKKIDEINKKKRDEIKDVSLRMLSDIIKNDELLRKLIDEYKNLQKSRTELMENMSVNQSDSSSFFNKKMDYELKDEIWENLLKN